MSVDEFLNLLNDHKLSESQLTNLQEIAEISKKFHKEAGIPFPGKDINNNTIILESGHQPNYLPHPGTWKKAVLLNFLQQKLENSIALFGFADYNLCTASILYSNKIPALTKDGCVKIGFSIQKKDRNEPKRDRKIGNNIKSKIPEQIPQAKMRNRRRH